MGNNNNEKETVLSKQLWLVGSNSEPIKKLKDIEIGSASIYTTKEEALDDFVFDNNDFILEVEIKAVKIDKPAPVEDKLINLKLN